MVINLILIPSKLFDIPKNADLWRSVYYATLLNSHLLRFGRITFLNNIYGGVLLDIMSRNKENNVISNVFVQLSTRFTYYSVRIIKPFYYL